ncbi:multiubiquitin domain-containing protein [Dokdonia sp. 4H-3-7-5]|uniref:multiubiquitin domain-containing protein n=1 Tax=Dokdonia sp. (strain 4H-3-7-5) TaxID=983548 RepID=UPI00020A648D|nr:multiubiquitin domain-containing protein [Dokdonia sp. 4H-3-7-5]AEE19462.1 hypothetical protein Krodi_1479 [Dokdonia sp. 4H-3-7-5]
MKKINITNLKDCFRKGIKPAIAFEYAFEINNDEFKTKEPIIEGDDLHELFGTNKDTHFIRMVTSKGRDLIGPNVKIDLTECGIERFIIRPYEQASIDIQECYCAGTEPFITYEYVLKINREKYSVRQEEISREEILALVDKDPKTHRVRMFTKNGKPILKDGQIIDLTKCGVERFVVEALDCTEGYLTGTTTNGVLTESDISFLKGFKFEVALLNYQNLNWLRVTNFDIPEGYNVKEAEAIIMIPPHYPKAQLDMIYFNPPLARADGKHIGALSNRIIDGKTYQQWSRHRTANNKWDPQNDDVESHIDLMISCLKAEFKKR